MANSRRSSSRSSTASQHRDDEYDHHDGLRITSIFSSLSTLYLAEKFSGMTITCNGHQFKAHRAIVCPQSSFFDKALTGGFQETATRVIDLPDDDPWIVEKFLQFLYTGNYDDGVIPTQGKPSHVAQMSVSGVLSTLSKAPGVTIPSEENRHSSQAVESEKPEATTATNEVENRGGIHSNADERGTPSEPAGEHNESDEDTGSNFSSDAESDSDIQSEPAEEYNEFDETKPGEGSDVPVADASKSRSEVISALADIRQDLLLPLRLYVMADKFDVPALRLLARDRFYRAAEQQWRDADYFPDVVDELYSCTSETEIAMREIVCRLVGSDIRGKWVRERMEPVMRKHGSFAVGVLNYALRDSITEW